MKFFILSITLLVWVGMGVWFYGQAATTADVTATVTVTTLSVAVSDGTVTYGTLATSATQDTIALGSADSQVVENIGNTAADINIRGATTDAWDLTLTIGTEEFRHRFASDDAGVAWATLSDAYTLLVGSLASDATQSLELEIQVPSTTTATAEQNPDITVQAN